MLRQVGEWKHQWIDSVSTKRASLPTSSDLSTAGLNTTADHARVDRADAIKALILPPF